MNRAAVIEQLKATQETLNKLLVLLESSEAEKFVAYLYQARRQFRLVSDRPARATKLEREILSSLRVVHDLGFNGDYHAWEHLLRIHD